MSVNNPQEIQKRIDKDTESLLEYYLLELWATNLTKQQYEYRVKRIKLLFSTSLVEARIDELHREQTVGYSYTANPRIQERIAELKEGKP